MATIEELAAAVTRLADDVGRLITLVQSQTPPDFQPQVDQLNAASDSAEAVLPPPAPPAE